jgi:23S rRNA (guanosine2251-2'-O)-methyltransferase
MSRGSGRKPPRQSQVSGSDGAAAPLGYGIHPVKAAMARGNCLEVLLDSGRKDSEQRALLAEAEERGIPVEWLANGQLDQLLGDVNHQGVAARLRPLPLLDEAGLANLLDSLDHPPLLLILDGVTDPHNLGACLRSADGAGVDAVVVPRDRAVGLTPVVRKVASGGAESVPLAQVTNLARIMKDLQQRGVWLVGAAGEADQELYTVDLTGPLALVLGAEGRGLRRLTREHCDHLARLPMLGSVSSLNVSVASGIFLYEALRQRQGGLKSRSLSDFG